MNVHEADWHCCTISYIKGNMLTGCKNLWFQVRLSDTIDYCGQNISLQHSVCFHLHIYCLCVFKNVRKFYDETRRTTNPRESCYSSTGQVLTSDLHSENSESDCKTAITLYVVSNTVPSSDRGKKKAKLQMSDYNVP
jgi:hypothetical protein